MPRPAAPDAVFRAVADPTRRAILDRLRLGARPVNDIARAFSVSRPAISRHLRLLRDARLVAERREGRMRLYVLDPRPLLEMEDWLAAYRTSLRSALARLKAHVETGERSACGG